MCKKSEEYIVSTRTLSAEEAEITEKEAVEAQARAIESIRKSAGAFDLNIALLSYVDLQKFYKWVGVNSFRITSITVSQCEGDPHYEVFCQAESHYIVYDGATDIRGVLANMDKFGCTYDLRKCKDTKEIATIMKLGVCDENPGVGLLQLPDLKEFSIHMVFPTTNHTVCTAIIQFRALTADEIDPEWM